MEGLILRTISLIVALSVAGPASADILQDLGDDFKACLLSQAIMYSSRSCHPPSELMPAIYAACANEEQSIYAAVSTKDGVKVADRTMVLVRERTRGEVVRFIVDGQIRSGCK